MKLKCKEEFSSVQFSRSVVSDSLQPHESQHARPPCPSPTPGVHSDSCPSSPWCHPAISSSVVPFSSCPNPSQHQSLFQWVNSLHEVVVHPKGNQPWIFILEELVLKLKFQCFGHLMGRADSLEKTLMLGKTGKEEKGITENETVGYHHRLKGHEFEQTVCSKSQTQLSDWTKTTAKLQLLKKEGINQFSSGRRI